MKTLKLIFAKKKEEAISPEMRLSFAKNQQQKLFNQEEFNRWFSDIVYHHHPINNQFYN